jgi:hypothetical protein
LSSQGSRLHIPGTLKAPVRRTFNNHFLLPLLNLQIGKLGTESRRSLSQADQPGLETMRGRPHGAYCYCVHPPHLNRIFQRNSELSFPLLLPGLGRAIRKCGHCEPPFCGHFHSQSRWLPCLHSGGGVTWEHRTLRGAGGYPLGSFVFTKISFELSQ